MKAVTLRKLSNTMSSISGNAIRLTAQEARQSLRAAEYGSFAEHCGVVDDARVVKSVNAECLESQSYVVPYEVDIILSLPNYGVKTHLKLEGITIWLSARFTGKCNDEDSGWREGEDFYLRTFLEKLFLCPKQTFPPKGSKSLFLMQSEGSRRDTDGFLAVKLVPRGSRGGVNSCNVNMQLEVVCKFELLAIHIDPGGATTPLSDGMTETCMPAFKFKGRNQDMIKLQTDDTISPGRPAFSDLPHEFVHPPNIFHNKAHGSPS
ncbi:hypothetical protein BDR03DRAFT_998089 [Suillus americanus]|nr:hypothetical protein BDR03DRAFT_998089 [Suillus americanus]